LVRAVFRRFSTHLTHLTFLTHLTPWFILLPFLCSAASNSNPFGLSTRPLAKPWLRMPSQPTGALPALLSQTGAFKDTRDLTPSDALIPYDLNVAFWSDGAAKSRWISVPNDGSTSPATIKFSKDGEWTFPSGTVFVKHFEFNYREYTRRLETRLLVCDSTGGVYGVTYKWRPDNSDADLLATNLTESIVLRNSEGTYTQAWYYPSREDCRICHTTLAGQVLGVKTRQLNRDLLYPSGVTDNQLRAWNHIGLFDGKSADFTGFPKLAPPNDHTRTLEERARSWLDANCAHCHRPGGTVANFDARYDTPLPRQNLIDGPVLIDEGIDNARAIAPHDAWRSIVLMRAGALDGLKMPPLAHNLVDAEGMALLKDWINSLPGRAVLPPPAITPVGGNFPGPIKISLNENEPDAAIHYTLDGSVPTKSDPVYEKPILLSEPAVLRAKAFKTGFTKSITAQGVFVVGKSDDDSK